jgi:hypothetical protein
VSVAPPVSAEAEAAQARFEALRKADPAAARLIVDCHNLGLIGGLRSLTYIRTSEAELGRRQPPGVSFRIGSKNRRVVGELPNGSPRVETSWSLIEVAK